MKCNFVCFTLLFHLFSCMVLMVNNYITVWVKYVLFFWCSVYLFCIDQIFVCLNKTKKRNNARASFTSSKQNIYATDCTSYYSMTLQVWLQYDHSEFTEDGGAAHKITVSEFSRMQEWIKSEKEKTVFI